MSATAAAWLAMGGAATLQLLGSSLVLALLRGRALGFCLASGLLWGVAAYGLGAATIVLGRTALGWLPLLPMGAVAGACLLCAAAGIGLVQLRAASGRISSLRLLAYQAASAVLVALATLFAVAFDFSTLTPDSLAIVEAGLGLARLRDPQLVVLDFVAARGILGVLIHAPADALPFDFLWFASPVLGLASMATLAAAAVGAIRDGGRSGRVAALVVGLGLLWLAGCYFWTYQLFYVHVNQLAGAYLLLFLVAAWRALVEADDAWLPLAGLALLAFQMLRVEGAFFAALFVAIWVLERAARTSPARRDLWLVLPGAAWCLALAAMIGEESHIVDAGRLLAMAGLLLACLPLGWIARRPQLRRVAERLPGAALAALGIGLLLLVALRPGHMIDRSGVLAWNALATGLWSTAWAFVPAVALAAPLLGRVPHQRFVQLALAAYFVGLLGLTYAGHWREGWYDSGNRMLSHALPALVWLGMLRAAAIVPVAREAPQAVARGSLLSGGRPGDP